MKTKSIIAALLLAASSAFAQVPSYVPTNGLVGWWPFNGNANDESGNGNNGTVNGATLTQDRFGNANNAFSFNGTNTFIEVQSSNTLQLNNNYSISLWFKSNINNNNSPYNYTILSKINYSGWYGGYEIMTGDINPNGGIIHTGNINGNFVFFGPANGVTQGTWYYIVFTFNGSQLRMYSNGQLIDSLNRTGSIQTGNDPLRFGRRGGSGIYNQWFNGLIDDIGIWNRALTQQEITALYISQTCNSSSNAITADGPTTFCAGNFVNLSSDVVGGTYQWKKNGVNISTNSTSRTYKATATGSYTCVATCNGTALTSNAIAVTSKTNAAASVTASGATSFCAGDSVTLNCTNLGSNYSVQWYRTNISIENATAYSQVVKQPGTYKVVTKNLSNGCSRISGSSAIVAVNCRIAGDITSGTPTPLSESEAKFTANDLSQGVNIFPNPNNGSFTFAYDGEEYGDAVLQVINSMGQMIYNTNVNVTEGGYTQELQLGDNSTKGIYIVRLLINGSYHDSRVLVR